MRRTLSLTAAVAVATLLAACSSGGSDDASPSPSDPASSASESASPSATETSTESPTGSGTESPTASDSAAPAVAGGIGADDDVAEECAAGIGLVVDVGDLDDDRDDAVEDSLEASEGAWCITTADTLTARELLDLAEVTTEGTTEYGDAVVCRVNGVPGADLPIANPEGGSYTETCASMAPAYAYWAMWLKPAGAEWEYAAEGVDTQPVAPGERLELLFTLNGEPVNPDGGSAG